MPVTQDGVPWGQARSLGDQGPTNDELNWHCLAPLSRQHGYDLCIHPFANMINFTGFQCSYCDQPVTEAGSGPEARRLRTATILAAYPHLARS